MYKHQFVIEGEELEVASEKKGESFEVAVGEKKFDIAPLGGGLFSVSLNGRKKTLAAVTHKGVTFVDIDSVLFEVVEPSEEGAAGGGDEQSGAKDKIFAPMPGKIVKIMVDVGDTVAERQQVVIVEAMKMENPVLAKANGTVKAVNFAAGDQVDTDTPIVELELEG